MKWKKPKNKSGNVVTEDGSKQPWKLKKNDKKSANAAVAGTDKKARNLIIAKKLLVFGAIVLFLCGMFWMYSNGKLGKFSPSEDNKSDSVQEPSREEIQKQIEEEGKDGPTVDPETIPVTG